MSIDILRANDYQQITIASGATGSSVFALGGAASASLHVPAGLKGQLRLKQRHYESDTLAFAKDNTSTIITQTLATVAKPCKIALRSEFLACKLAQIVMTSAQTGPKSLTIFTVG